jgi:glutathione S-transferase
LPAERAIRSHSLDHQAGRSRAAWGIFARMILVGQYDSPYVRRVAVTLHCYGFSFSRNPISVFGDAEAMATINPLVRIPSLQLDDGEILIDSGAIIDHLDEIAGPERALTPRSGPARRRVLQLIAAATGTIDKAGAIVYERHFHAPGKANEDWLLRCRGQMLGGLRFLESRVTGDWLAEERFTQADLTTAALIGYLRLRLPEIRVEHEFPRLTELSDRCEAMPAFAAARPSPDEVMPR